MSAYYNEFNPHAAQWLRNLIAAGLIAPGVVDERSIEDVTPNELRGFTQCHFFAGIGVWSFALRSAGWRDDQEIWTGSCPCQPFSAAGSGAGFADERHLWPAFHHLIAERRPAIVLGEQVASSLVDPWIDLVHADLEALGYAFGGVPFPSAGIGAPHIRDRLYWAGVADAYRHRQPAAPVRAIHHPAYHLESRGGFDRLADTYGVPGGQGRAHDGGRDSGGHAFARAGSGGCSGAVELADASSPRLQGGERRGEAGAQRAPDRYPVECRSGSGLADADRSGRGASGRPGVHREGQARPLAPLGHESRGLAYADGRSVPQPVGEAYQRDGHPAADAKDRTAGPINGFWGAADWLGCRDGKWRPVEPGTFPLVNGPAGRVGRSGADWRTAAGKEGQGHRAGRLKGYGNAINAEAARIFIECLMGTL